ncbi:hypothetical protein VTN77DRAFT_3468 [Rasamsonia byssochlamydoides]|uniref:uncharacterized protein n=1 Tax=Rasamsonia byssochlamydoides TaxID=89139 RepID=UPI0037427552
MSAADVKIEGNFDPNIAVREKFPPGVRILSAESYGSSAWSKTAKVTAEEKNGKPIFFFLKEFDGEVGRAQLEGEFTGMSELHNLMPNFVPKPYAWGKLKGLPSSSPVYFFLIEFKNFSDGLRDPVRLGSRLAELHRKSVSPTGKFGFHMTTYDGARTQVVEWDSSWTSFFSKLLAVAYRHDVETNGCWEELDKVFNCTLSHLIPRLLGVLESGGRSIKPCLIHGDLWEGNIGTDIETGDPWIFDAAAYYAHHEMELGIWRAERHQLRAKIYRKEYLRNMEPSGPVDEWDDRNRLYSVKTNLMYSACVFGSPSRQLAYNDLVYLIDKYVH